MTSVKGLIAQPNMSFRAAGDPGASIVGAKIDDLYQNLTSGEMFRCVVATFGGQAWHGSQGTLTVTPVTSPSYPGLVLGWDLGDTLSGSTQFDMSPNGNDGTITGASVVAGVIGNALDFNTISDTVFADITDVFTTQEITISSFINLDSITDLTTTQHIWVLYGSGGSGDFISFLKGSSLASNRKSLVITNNQFISNGQHPITLPPAGVFTHVAFVISGTNVKSYISGTLHNETTSSVLSSFAMVRLNVSGLAGNNGTLQKQDHFKLFNEALTAPQIAELAAET